MFKDCYHLCTSALKKAVLCRDKEDYIFLWNSIAIGASALDIKIFCLCLMSNHFHILLRAKPETVNLFMKRLKTRLGRFMMRKYSTSIAREIEYELFPVLDRKSFCQEVAYILRNPYKAKLAGPFAYPWNSALAYFQSLNRSGRLVSDLSVRERMSLLGTKQPLPGKMLVSPEGIILPESFIDVSFVEQMFGNSSFLFFDMLRKWNLEDIVDGAHGETVAEAYSDDEVLRGIRDICRDDFGGISPERMDQKMRIRLARRIHARFGASRSQLLRLLPVDEYLLERIL